MNTTTHPQLARAAAYVHAAPTVATRLLHKTGLALVVSVLSAIALSAWAQPAPAASGMAPMHRSGSPMEQSREGRMEHHMGGSMAHRMGGMGGEMGPGMLLHGSPEHMGRMIDFMLDGLNATDAQRSQIKQIAVATATELKAQHETGRAMHMRAMQLFTAPNIDTAAVEKMRQQMLAQHDQASKRVMQAMLDIGHVLTPEQRAKIGERMRDRMSRMHDRAERMQKREAEPHAHR